MRSTASVVLAMSTLAFLSCDDDSDIIGLNDATKYGYIKVTVEGTRPDGEEFEVTRNFKFASATGPEYSSTVSTSEDGDLYRSFYVVRYAGAINESGDGEQNQAILDFTAQEDQGTGELNGTFGDFEIEFPVTTEDKEFFYVNEYIEMNVEDVTSYKYNEETGKLSLKYSTEYEGNSGPVKVTINVNVTVFEYINFPN
jgi:hypothetical protein